MTDYLTCYLLLMMNVFYVKGLIRINLTAKPSCTCSGGASLPRRYCYGSINFSNLLGIVKTLILKTCTGTVVDGNKLDRQTLLLYDIFRFQIWNMKNRKIINFDFIVDNTINLLRTIFILKPSVKLAFTRNNNLANILQATG